MSGQQIGTVVGGVVGAFLAPYTGGASIEWGMAIGGLIGGAVDPTKIKGPHIGQGQQQTATDGVPIAWILGTQKIAGTLIWAGKRREVEVDSGGKGSGTEQVTYEAHQDFAILVCESSELKDSTISSVLMVEQDGKIVYDVRPDSSFADSSSKWKTNKDFMFGSESQLPHPTMEADTGIGKTPAYRGRLVIVFKDVNLSPFGDRIPTYLFTVVGSGGGLSINDFGPNFETNSPSGFQLIDTAIANTTVDVGNNTYWRTPILSNPIYLYCEFELLSLSAGDPMAIALVNSAGLTLFDFMPRSEIDVDPTQAAYVNYITYGDVTPKLWVSLNEVLGTEGKYSFEASINLQSETINYFLRDGAGNILVNGTTNIRSRGLPENNIPVYLSFCRTGNSGLASVVKYTYASITYGAGQITLSDVVNKVCSRGGIDLGKIDATDLASYSISGYSVAIQCSAADALQPVLQSVFAFGTEVDAKLIFKFYGEDATITINPNDAVINDASGGAIQKTTRNQATEFPQKIIGTYIDPDQNFNTVTQQAERLAQTVIATGETDIQIPMAISGTQAKQAVAKAIKVAYATLEGTINLSVPYATASGDYLKLAAGEPFFEDGKRWVTDEIDIGINYLKLVGRYDRQSAYTSNVQAIQGNPPTPPTSQYSGPTDMMVMNLPSLRTQDTYGVYAAVRGIESSWRGCTIQISYDNKQSWQNVATATLPSVMGEIVSDSIDTSDGADTIVNAYGGQISSVTSEQLAANANAFAILQEDTTSSGVPEIRQAQFAALQSDGDYLLTGQLTGLNGTDAVVHSAGEKFAMLNRVYFIPIDLSFKGRTLYFRAIGFGEVAETATVMELLYDPDTTVIVDGGVVT